MRHEARWVQSTRTLLVAWVLVSVLAVVGLAAIAGVGMVQLNQTDDRLQNEIRVVETAYQLMLAADNQVVGMRGFALTSSADDLAAWTRGRDEFRRAEAAFRSQSTDPIDLQLLDRIAQLNVRYLQMGEQVIAGRQEGKSIPALLPQIAEAQAIKADMLSVLNALLTRQKMDQRALRAESDRIERNMKGAVLGLAAFAIPLVLLLAGMVSQRVLKPLADLSAATRAIGHGDLTARMPIRGEDEFGMAARAFNAMAEQIAVSLTEIHEAYEALSAQKSFTDLLLQAAGEGIFGLDTEGKATFFNPAATAMLGYSTEDLIGAPLHARIHHARRDGSRYPVHECPLLMGLKDGQTHRGQDEIFWRKDGSQFPVEYTSVPLFREGKLTGLVVTFRDASERLEAERASRLEAEREAAVALADEIREANEALSKASKLKSEFLANMSHELRTPLNSIIGYTELVLTDDLQDLDPLNRENLQTVVRNARHLLALINDILDISKIEAGRLTVYPEPFEPAQMLRSVLGIVEPLAQEKRLKLTSSIAPGVDMVVSDETKIRQVVLNLLSNAIKFTRDGGVDVQLLPRGTDRWAIVVKDTGIGIDAAHQDMIFEEFRQVDASTTREVGGTGLGLAISRKLAQFLGGEITVESGVDQGSTFTLELPRQSDAFQAPQPQAVPRIALLPEAGKPVVLAIDDNPEVLHLISEKLKRSPYHVVTASSGESGLKLAKELHPVAITLDIMMPRLDGWMVLRALKDDPETADIPVLILSFLENKTLGFSLGAAAYLTKPIDQRDLLRTLDRLCQESHACGGHVLVVDDDPNARKLYRQIFGREGLRVVEAANGREALEALEGELPILVILDLMMPQVDGFEVLARMRANARTRQVPVIVVTAKDLSDEDLARLTEVRHVIAKGEQAPRMLLDDLESLLSEVAPSRKEKTHERQSP